MVKAPKVNVRVVLENGKLLLVECPSEEIICEFTLDDLAEIIEFRYATPWNKSKDILEKLVIIINDLVDAYSNVPERPPTKDDLMKAVKLRMSYSEKET
ncbi:hypothetical protein BD01_0830 [Thermococcus nautili]|uniref:Uncharacterized protein n=1 Tax=Thermococcus nautili TaxID=195522 RepID=W8NTJ8_9EURY|nr:hypothetical protein BD01_0830 [Thermococcus nautili]